MESRKRPRNWQVSISCRSRSGRPFQPFGDLLLEFQGLGKIKNYQRSLDFDDAEAITTMGADGITYTRSVIASHPDGVIAALIQPAASGKQGLHHVAVNVC